MRPITSSAIWISVRRLTSLLERACVRRYAWYARQRHGPRFFVRYVERHAQHRGGEDFALRVGLERNRTAAAERSVQQKIERAEIRQLEAFDVALDDAAEMVAHALLREVAL